MEVAGQQEGSVSSPCLTSSFPLRPPEDQTGQELFAAGLEGGGRQPGFAEILWVGRHRLPWRALSALLVCRLEAGSFRSPKLCPQGAMATSRGRLYLWMYLAAALASFLAGFMVGKYEPLLPSAGLALVPAAWGGARGSLEAVQLGSPSSLRVTNAADFSRTGSRMECILTFLMKCD